MVIEIIVECFGSHSQGSRAGKMIRYDKLEIAWGSWRKALPWCFVQRERGSVVRGWRSLGVSHKFLFHMEWGKEVAMLGHLQLFSKVPQTVWEEWVPGGILRHHGQRARRHHVQGRIWIASELRNGSSWSFPSAIGAALFLICGDVPTNAQAFRTSAWFGSQGIVHGLLSVLQCFWMFLNVFVFLDLAVFCLRWAYVR